MELLANAGTRRGVFADAAADTPAGCRITIDEDAVEGPGQLVPSAVRQPLIHVRNIETLRRLRFLAEGRVVIVTQ